MTLNTSTPEVRFAIDAVRQATNLVTTVQNEMVSNALEKGDKSPVTVADFAAQALVGKLLQETFPADPLVGEEDSATLSKDKEKMDAVTAFVGGIFEGADAPQVAAWIDHGAAEPPADNGRFWTLDPIDGTKGFLRGMQYVVAFALLEDGEVTLGVLGCPNLEAGQNEVLGGAGSLVVAVRGGGTWVTALNGEEAFEQVHVSEIDAPNEARFLRSFETGHTNVSQLDVIGDKMGGVAEPVRLDSQAKYSILACGAGDAIFRLISSKMPDYKEKIWDQAAGMIVVEEAGGMVTDLDGKKLDFTQGRTLAKNRGVLATNGKLHAVALQAIKDAGA